MQIILVTAFLVAIVTIACGPSATTSESESGASPQQPEESDPALLLSEESAISILQAFLQECVLGWNSVYSNEIPPSAQEKKSWLMELATQKSRDFEWTASYHGVTEVPNTANRAGFNLEAETWVVIGPGLERADFQLVVPGRWKVYAGQQRAFYLDAPARLAYEEYNLWIRSRGNSSCYR